MLILQRKPNEAVLIGDDIRIVVLRSDSGGVRIGIEAPDEIPILREEIVEEVRSETVRASQAASDSASGLKPPEPSS
ncbi:MAG: carbon storage regulator CsrA [Gemmatimonadetes bacterium]|nr:carbon storage regulator CsrA [Gemmatimonadota bacterium]